MSGVRADVCVLGGGPAGASATLRLCALGYRVCLLEKLPSPRRRPGESLTPAIEGALDAIGVRDRLSSADALRPARAEIRWSHEPSTHDEAAHRCVDRAEFDAHLLAAARERGVLVLQPACARRAARTADGWMVETDEHGAIDCRFVVDACGRGGFLPGTRSPMAARTIALHGHFRGDGLPEAACVEASRDAWCWGAPLPTGVFSAMVFLDPSEVRAAGRAGIEALLRDRLGQSELLAGCKRAPLEGRARALDATPYAAASIVGPDWIKLGEASFALDPLSSTGVERAMRSAITGSAVVNTQLSRPGRAELAASFHRDRQRESVAQHQRWAASYYREARHQESPFWRRRAESAGPLDLLTPLSPHALAAPADKAMPGPQAPAGKAMPGPEVPADRPMPGPEALSWRVGVADGVRLAETPCLVGDEIAPVLALAGPGLPRPVAFVEGVELAPLLAMVVAGEPLYRLVGRWARHLSEKKAVRVAMWLVGQGVIVGSPPTGQFSRQ
jgi:flavin-dependent dehydrogenase